MNIGQNIMNLRKGAKLSQEQLAEKMGVTRQTISNWELDESSPDLKQGKELSKIFNVSLDDLTGDLTFEYLDDADSDRKITIISSIENVIVTCNKINLKNKNNLKNVHQKFNHQINTKVAKIHHNMLYLELMKVMILFLELIILF